MEAGGGDDIIQAYGGANYLSGGDGNDKLYGASGSDMLLGGSGDDYLSGNAGDDKLYGDAGNDTLSGGDGNDYLESGAGDDKIEGGYGNDVLDGGTGNDYLSGGSGDDIYVINLGDGVDEILDPSGKNILRFGEGIHKEDIRVGYNEAEELILEIGENGQKIVIKKFGTEDYWDDYWNYTCEFADGSQIGIDKVSQIYGTEGNENYKAHWSGIHMEAGGGDDIIQAYGGENYLSGGAGDDKLYGAVGNDTILGGSGNDYLSGGSGNDTYIFNPGDGKDTIYDTSGNDLLQIDTSVENLMFERSGNNLLVSILGTEDSVSINNWYSGSSYKVETFSVSDGYSLAYNQVEQLIQSMASFEEQTGLSWADAIRDNSSDAKNIIYNTWVQKASL